MLRQEDVYVLSFPDTLLLYRLSSQNSVRHITKGVSYYQTTGEVPGILVRLMFRFNPSYCKSYVI